jgi:hypothetical protein
MDTNSPDKHPLPLKIREENLHGYILLLIMVMVVNWW